MIPLVRGGTRSRRAAAVLAEVARRVEQGHREIVLTGVNLGCFRDREAGYTLAAPGTRGGAVPGVERLRLSSIEVNHLTDELVAALRETPARLAASARAAAVGRRRGAPRDAAPLHGRRSTSRSSRRSRDFNLTADVIVGFPNEDEAAFARTLEVVEEAGLTKVHVFPYSPRPGTATADRGRGVAAGEEGAQRAAACALRRALPSPLGDERGFDRRVLVDRPGRGYADDYTPWLLDAEVGSFVAARAVACSEEGILAVAA